MSFGALADLVVVAHLVFVMFVVAGGLLVLRWPRLAWAHIPAAVWGAVVELTGWICPLTPFENALRQRSSTEGYRTDFVARYIVPTLYPDGLTRETQLLLGACVLALNAAIYALVIRRRRMRRSRAADRSAVD